MPQLKQHDDAAARSRAFRCNQKLRRLGPLAALFPYWGGKSVVAPLIWQRLGNVRHYIEPFAGSLGGPACPAPPPEGGNGQRCRRLAGQCLACAAARPPRRRCLCHGPRVQHRALGQKRLPRAPPGDTHRAAHCGRPLL